MNLFWGRPIIPIMNSNTYQIFKKVRVLYSEMINIGNYNMSSLKVIRTYAYP